MVRKKMLLIGLNWIIPGKIMELDRILGVQQKIDRFGYKFEGKISPAMQALTLVEREKNKKFDTKKLKISTINRIF